MVLFHLLKHHEQLVMRRNTLQGGTWYSDATVVHGRTDKFTG